MANFLIPYDIGTEVQYTADFNKLALVSGNVETQNLGIKGLTLDGLDDGAIIADHNNFDYGAGDFAFSYLIIPNSIGVSQILESKDDNVTQRQFQIAIIASGGLQIAYWKAGSVAVIQASTASHVSIGALTHLLLQKRSGTFQIYVNGVSVTLGSLTGVHGAMQSTSADIFFGIGETGLLPYDGWMCRAGKFGSSLSAIEAMAFYLDNIRLAVDDITFPGSPTSFHPMDDGAEGTSADGVVIRDLLNNNRHHADGNNGANNTGLTFDTEFLPVRYDANNPSIFKTIPDSGTITSWDGVSVTFGGGNQGSVGLRFSEDGIAWKYWNGSAWVESTGQFNTIAIANANISSFPTDAQSIAVDAFLISNGSQKIEITLIQISFSENQSPLVNAGSDKPNVKDNETIAPCNDGTASDPDGTIEKIEMRLRHETLGTLIDWFEIDQGGFGTLVEAWNAELITFNEPGTNFIDARVTDNEDATSEDSLTVTVSKYSTNWTVKDPDGNHLQHVNFDPGDGSGIQLKDSPFTYEFEFGESHVEISKPGWISVEVDVDITGAGQSFTVILEEYLAKSDIPTVADEVALRVNRPTDVTMIVEDDDLIMVIEDDDEIVMIVED